VTVDWSPAVARLGLSEHEAERKAALFRSAHAGLIKLRGPDDAEATAPSGVVAHWVPGRVEFLGKHTDYAGGRSLLCTVERGVCVVAFPRDDARVRVHAASTGEIVDCALAPAACAPDTAAWSTYVATVARRLARNFGEPLRGADIAFTSDLPIAAGMSSSSALVVAFFLTLSAINRLDERDEYRADIHSLENLADYVGCVESGFDFGSLAGGTGVGTLSGCEDQTAMLCGRGRELVQYSFCPVRFERSVPLPPGYQLAIAASGVRAEKTRDALEKYNALSRKARAIVELWRAATGRADTTLAEAIASGPGSTAALRDVVQASSTGEFSSADLLDRFDQFVAESERIIPAAGDALLHADLSALGLLAERSVDGAARLLGNQVPETLALTSLARDLGAVAASPFGAGFGGSVWALIKEEDKRSELVERWRAAYVEQFPEHATSCEFFVTRAGPPASRIA
jgi:galactokinase